MGKQEKREKFHSTRVWQDGSMEKCNIMKPTERRNSLFISQSVCLAFESALIERVSITGLASPWLSYEAVATVSRQLFH